MTPRATPFLAKLCYKVQGPVIGWRRITSRRQYPPSRQEIANLNNKLRAIARDLLNRGKI